MEQWIKLSSLFDTHTSQSDELIVVDIPSGKDSPHKHSLRSLTVFTMR